MELDSTDGDVDDCALDHDAKPLKIEPVEIPTNVEIEHRPWTPYIIAMALIFGALGVIAYLQITQVVPAKFDKSDKLDCVLVEY